MYLHYDSETTGLFLKGIPSNDPRQPRLLSLSAVLDDENGNMRGVISSIIKHEGYTIDERLVGDDGKPTAFAVNGISNEIMNRYGRPLGNVMFNLFQMMETVQVMSAFNHHFDFKFLKICCAQMTEAEGEMVREFLETKSAICTMESAAPIVKGNPKERFVSLEKAYAHFFSTGFAGAHNSMNDAMAHRKLFYVMKSQGVLKEAKPLTRREYDTPLPGGPVGSQEVAI